MPTRRAPYPPEFRAEAIRLARTSGRPHAQIAHELGMTAETLRETGELHPGAHPACGRGGQRDGWEESDDVYDQ